MASLRFPSPLIEPDVRISRIRLSDWFHLRAHGVGQGARRVLGGLGFEKLSSNCLERRERPSLVGSHEAAVADNVSSEDGGQPTFYALFTHGLPLNWNAEEVAV